MLPFALSKLEEPRTGLLQLLDEQWSIGRKGRAFCAAIRDWTLEATAGGELLLKYPASVPSPQTAPVGRWHRRQSTFSANALILSGIRFFWLLSQPSSL